MPNIWQRWWAAYVNTNGRQIYLGCWADKRLAASARDEYVREHFPTASLNFPDDSPFSTSEIANARIAQKRNRFPGIRFKRGAWEAWARLNGRKRYLGRFKTEEEAWLARQSFLSI